MPGTKSRCFQHKHDSIFTVKAGTPYRHHRADGQAIEHNNGDKVWVLEGEMVKAQDCETGRVWFYESKMENQ